LKAYKVARFFMPFILGGILSSSVSANGTKTVEIGSKKFTESVILGELVAQLGQHVGFRVRHRRELGGTRVLWNALLAGEIDIYPEYTGTLWQEILAGRERGRDTELKPLLAAYGVRMSAPLGFNNTYAIGMLKARARALGIETISDLRVHPTLRFGFSSEFMDRNDGWPGLRKHYQLPQEEVRGLDHDLAYRGLASGILDAVDLYATDAEIRYYDLRILKDDLHYFPGYQAVLLYREELEESEPGLLNALKGLEGRISQSSMITMNEQAKIQHVSESQVAASFLSNSLGIESSAERTSAVDNFLRYTQEHLVLVSLSLSAAILIAIPLGIVAARWRRVGQLILAGAGIIQTIPSLAILVFMIPLLGIGGPPAVVALFLYSLLPIIRNTFTGLSDISLEIRESAEVLGLSPLARLKLIELPIAMPTILAGIKTSAVINIGTATLGALIGAGGYGQPILTGIRLDDVGLILQGAVPAAGLALVVQGGFELAERYLVPKGLRL
jgi:osmoprotectant transport system permease protein